MVEQVVNGKIVTYAGDNSLKIVTKHEGVISVMMVSCHPGENVVYWFGIGKDDDYAPSVEVSIDHGKIGNCDHYGVTHNFSPDKKNYYEQHTKEVIKTVSDKEMNERIS